MNMSSPTRANFSWNCPCVSSATGAGTAPVGCGPVRCCAPHTPDITADIAAKPAKLIILTRVIFTLRFVAVPSRRAHEISPTMIEQRCLGGTSIGDRFVTYASTADVVSALTVGRCRQHQSLRDPFPASPWRVAERPNANAIAPRLETLDAKGSVCSSCRVSHRSGNSSDSYVDVHGGDRLVGRRVDHEAGDQRGVGGR